MSQDQNPSQVLTGFLHTEIIHILGICHEDLKDLRSIHIRSPFSPILLGIVFGIVDSFVVTHSSVYSRYHGCTSWLLP